MVRRHSSGCREAAVPLSGPSGSHGPPRACPSQPQPSPKARECNSPATHQNLTVHPKKLISELLSTHSTPSQIFLPKKPHQPGQKMHSAAFHGEGGNCGEGLRVWGTHTRAGTAQRRQKGDRKVCCEELCEIRHSIFSVHVPFQPHVAQQR